MTVTVASFQAQFPEFAGTPTATISFWLPIAQSMVNATLWNNSADAGVCLALAHFLALGGAGANAAKVGVLNSKSVGGAAAGYDIASVTDPNGGQWNQTTYGTRFRMMQRMFGAGGLQMSGGGYPAGTVIVES
jgi:hypothetical protein